MLKLNQKGALDPIVIILLILVLAMGGYIGYTFLNKDKDDTPVETTQVTQQETQIEDQSTQEDDIPEGWIVYQNEKFGLSLYHPADWEVGGELHDHPTIVGSRVNITSPDYQSVEEAIGGTTTGVGGLVNISIYDIEEKTLQERYPEGGEGLMATIINRENGHTVTEIDDNEAWQYEIDYEGDSAYTTEFIVGGRTYSIAFNGEGIEDDKAVLFSVYQQILETVKVN